MAAQDVDDFGLPIRQYKSPSPEPQDGKEPDGDQITEANKGDGEADKKIEPESHGRDITAASKPAKEAKGPQGGLKAPELKHVPSEISSNNSDDDDFEDAPSTPIPDTPKEPTAPAKSEEVKEEKASAPTTAETPKQPEPSKEDKKDAAPAESSVHPPAEEVRTSTELNVVTKDLPNGIETKPSADPSSEYAESPIESPSKSKSRRNSKRTTWHKDVVAGPTAREIEAAKKAEANKAEETQGTQEGSAKKAEHSRELSSASSAAAGMSEFSHYQLTAPKEDEKEDDDGGWQTMPAYAPYDIYDENDKIIAREHDTDADNHYGYAGRGGAGKGYTKVLVDEDAESETSLDDNTRYLFKEALGTSIADMDEEARDAMSQLQATKDLLTEGQRIAYVGVVRLELSEMVKEAETIPAPNSKSGKKLVSLAAEAMQMWSQKIMIRLYGHMEISSAEQVMIEQLASHGVRPDDLTPALMQNSRVKNPMAMSNTPGTPTPMGTPQATPRIGGTSPKPPSGAFPDAESVAEAPPPYETHGSEDMPEVLTPSQLPDTAKIDIDLRWTVLCDLFLVLIADSIYDARSRVLLERVGKDMEVPWVDICRFEKRVTDALEMQQEADKENWNEEEHLETRRKMALRKKYMMMGLATVGGGLVIGLSAGLLAPLIGAGLAAGFTTIGVTGTSSFLAGAGGAAIITSGAAASGGIMGGKAARRRMGEVKTFEYKPLHNNKRVNLIVTISGWMTSKADDVRLPYSTIDPVMGDIYSILWEPEMLTSMGDTINILATEALTQGLQQILGSTILISLMAALQLPVVLTKLAYLIDNPWAVSLDRATAAGLVLADSLIDRNLGTRPITLVGYSLGSRVIFSCLLELARKGAFGLVQNVYMFGSPLVVKPDEFIRARTAVSGRWVNGYNKNDWILGYLFRLTNGGIRRVAGLASVDGVPGLENMDCTEIVVGHMDYRQAMPRLLRDCGWLVESDEFTEIEDPDPDRYRERQKELISEIEDARKGLEKEKKGGAFSFFSKRKKAQREEWEVYEDGKGQAQNGSSTPDLASSNQGVLFDVDAIRAELAKEEMEVKELKSTLPPMKLDMQPTPPPSLGASPRDMLRETKSSDASMSLRQPSFDNSRKSQERTPTKSPYANDAYHYDEDEVQMTFDTSYSGKEPPPVPEKDHPSRPGITSSKTTPNMALADPWGDEDEDFGKEKEISMTFA